VKRSTGGEARCNWTTACGLRPVMCACPLRRCEWSSIWYGEEDLALRRKTRELPANAHVTRAEIERFPKRVTLTIHTARPGIVIGRRGSSVKALRRSLEQISSSQVTVDVQEVKQPELDARLVAENIASQLERWISHGRTMRRVAGRSMEARAEGSAWNVRAGSGERRWVGAPGYLKGECPLTPCGPTSPSPGPGR
jgi:small subunit ribosomal protein S3